MQRSSLTALFALCLISGLSFVTPARAAVDTASPLDGATVRDQGEQRQTPQEGPRIGAVGESSGVFHMGASGCNAWVVDQNHIVTNNHCVDRGGVKLVFYRQGGKIEITNCKPAPVARSAKLDYAVFQCPNIGAKVPPVRIANRNPVTGEELTLVTHDLDNPGKQRHAKARMGAPITLSHGGAGYETIGATVISGNSGSVIYDKQGNAVGLVWGAESTNPKTGVMSSLHDVVADIKRQTSQVAFNLTTDPGGGRQVADTPSANPRDGIVRSPSEEPATRPAEARPADTPARVADAPVGTTPVDAVSPGSSVAASVQPTRAQTDTGSSFKDHLPTIALVGAAVVGAFLVYKIIQDKNETDRKYAELQMQMYLQQQQAATTTVATTSTTELTTTTTTGVNQPYTGPVSTVLKRDAASTDAAAKFKPAGMKKVPMMVKRLGPQRMPYLRTDYVQQRPTAEAPSRRLREEAL